jgi:TPP-dependent pyruvate/acetoin dehydrogenase alpha subunit
MLTPVLDSETRIELFRQMLRIRRIEEEIARRYADQQMRCPVHLSVGQEAAAVGACAVLRATDPIFSTHRCHGHYLAKGGDLTAMIAEIHGKVTGCCSGRGGSMHLFDQHAGVMASVPIVGGNVPLAVGAALAAKQTRRPDVSVAFFGDGAFEEGVVHESANFAGCHRLPVVFFLENNRYSVYTPLGQRQPERSLLAFAEAHGLDAAAVDGNDVLAVRNVMLQAVARARRGEGPSLVVADTYRFLEHCGPADDDALGYRPKGELASWMERCPLVAFENALRESGELDLTTIDELEHAIADEIAAAFTAALAAPAPAASTATELVYA